MTVKSFITLAPDIENFSKGHFTFIPYYSTFTIEEEIERLEYDIGSLLVSML